MAVLQLASAIRKQQSTVSNHHSLLAIVFLLDYKFKISYQETAIGNEYHQLETISNKAAGPQITISAKQGSRATKTKYQHNKVAGEAATSNAASRWPRKAIASALTQNRKFILEHMSNSLNFYLNGFKSFNQLKSVNTFMNNLQIKFSSLNLYLTTYIITTYILE